MRVDIDGKRLRLGSLSLATVRIGSIAVLGFLAICQPAKADPLLLETGEALGPIWLVLIAGVALEAFILARFVKRPFGQILAVSVLANLVTGFTGFVALLYCRMLGVPVLPVGPTLLASIAIELVITSLLLIRTPFRMVLRGVIAANLASALIALAVLGLMPLPGPLPGAGEDLALASSMTEIQRSIDTYYSQFGFYPSWLAGGSRETASTKEYTADPLIEAGLLESYPPNPYAEYLRSRRLNTLFLLTGLGQPVRQVKLDDPGDKWEAKWFPLMKKDPRFGDADNDLLCANGLSEQGIRESHEICTYRMSGQDYIPGCFFYKAYDFNGDGLADDYILGVFGWPGSSGTAVVDLIDGKTGEICLSLDGNGRVRPGEPDGLPEEILALHIAGTRDPEG